MPPSDIAIGEACDLGVASGLLPDLHALYVDRGGAMLTERYYEGADENWGRDLGRRRFDAAALHDLRSVTKSITSLLYGIALERGLVPPPEAPLLSAFPEYADLAGDARRVGWTIANALNMTLGIRWNEDLPYTDPENSEIAMELAEDRYRFVLAQPIDHEPGTRWTYCGGAAALIGAIIERGTGQSLEAFAREALFGPLGIGAFEWNSGGDGIASPASGLRLATPDLARIGRAVLNGGRAEGRQVIPESWIARCRTPVTATPFGLAYSHFWYLSDQPGPSGPVPVLSANGNGGQRLYLMPTLDAVAVVFCGAYNRPDQWMTPTLLLQRIILPALVQSR
ncbi:MAG: serine hydrolase [Hyphomicrobiaceae bacterium]|nr:serine hydrolase [Hyphomicrobiaceae bacterium]